MVGLDLSENMVEIAHEKDLYETLYVAEAADFLEDNEDAPFDIVTATDVLPYVGFLEELFFGVADNLEKGGYFLFSSETLPDETLAGRDFMVGPHQRFAHSEGYVRKTLAAAGFEVIEIGDITVRLEDGEPIAGHLVAARKTR
jgi:predicted TPR repeat methyltransferase